MPITAEEVAREAMTTAAEAGMACTVHAIGDAAVRRALDLMSDLQPAAIPHRIEHFQCVHPADLNRAAAAGIVVSMQPAHLLVDIPCADRQWGARSRGAYAFKSLLQRGTMVAFGSDVPVATLDPRDGVFAAMERRMLDGAPMPGWYPEERLELRRGRFAPTLRPTPEPPVSPIGGEPWRSGWTPISWPGRLTRLSTRQWRGVPQWARGPDCGRRRGDDAGVTRHD